MSGRGLILILFVALFVPMSLARGFWDPDEGRYGEVAREVWQGEGALVPHLAGVVYTQKPPLFFWLAAGGQMLAGAATAPASRLPSALSTLVTALLILSMVRRSYGEREGLLAGAIYLTSGMVLQMGMWIGIDALVTALVTGCMYLQQYRSSEGRRPVWATAGIYVLLAGIVLAKVGPVAIAVLAMAGTAWMERGWRGLFPKHLLWGVPLLALLLAAWAIPAGREAGVDYLWGLTGGQAGRIADSDSHRRPLYYYFTRFPPFFLPWLVIVPAAACWLRGTWREGGRARLEAGRYLLWFAIPFLVFSLVSGKRERYILPVFPAAAAMTAVAAIRLETTKWFRPLVARPLLGTAAVLGVLGLLVAASPFFVPGLIAGRVESVGPSQLAEVLGAIRDGRWIVLLAGLSAAGVAAESLLRKRAHTPAAPVCVATAFLVLALAAAAIPALDRAKSYEPLARGAVLFSEPETTFGLVKLKPGPFCLALDRSDVLDIEGDGAIDEAAARLSSDPGLILFATRKNYEAISLLLAKKPTILFSRRVGSRDLVAFRRR